MHEFTIWAPYANRLQIIVDGSLYPMEPQADGCWLARITSAGHDSDYDFLINDDPHPYPDPRSLWQPKGVHAASRVYDHNRYSWRTSATWSAPALADSVLYELHIGTFTPKGTFDAAIAHLPYLKELGITHVEIMPVASFPGRWGWGYDGVALYAPQEAYGGPDGLKRLVDACHNTGLAAVLDVVYNHFGPVGNYTGVFGNYVMHEYATPWGGVVNLDSEGSAQVRRFFIDNALMWLRDYRFDALRLDAIHALQDKSPTHFLTELSGSVAKLSKQMNRPLRLIAESSLNDPIVVTPRNLGGRGMDAQWSDDFHHALHTVLTSLRSRCALSSSSMASSPHRAINPMAALCRMQKAAASSATFRTMTRWAIVRAATVYTPSRVSKHRVWQQHWCSRLHLFHSSFRAKSLPRHRHFSTLPIMRMKPCVHPYQRGAAESLLPLGGQAMFPILKIH
jgi:maltooligosyltrehalose trehalohydrolase